MDVTLRYFDGCPNWQIADERLMELALELRFTLTREVVDTEERAAQTSFRGSPTILVDGQDVFAQGDEPVGLACRVYQTPEGPAGAPTLAQLRAMLT